MPFPQPAEFSQKWVRSNYSLLVRVANQPIGKKEKFARELQTVTLQTVLVKCTWLHHNVCVCFNLSSLAFVKTSLSFWRQMLRFIANGGIVRIIVIENIFSTLPICQAPCSGLYVYFLIKSSLQISEAGTVTLSNLQRWEMTLNLIPELVLLTPRWYSYNILFNK